MAVVNKNKTTGLLNSKRTGHRGAFTLVELLVVIGIISLLITVLLPALNKARQQANLIDCESRMRQMGQALTIYVSENAGLLPYGDVRHDPTVSTPWENNVSDPANQEFSWYWTFTLSKEIQSNITGSDGLVHNLSPIFHDVDSIDTGISFRYANDYTCNPRIFPDNWETEHLQGGGTVAPQYVIPRRLSNIKPSTVFLFWDAPQCADWNNNAYEQATDIDGNNLTYGNYLFTGSNVVVPYNRAANPGLDQLGVSAPSKLYEYVPYQKQDNRDLLPGEGYFATQMRFRHLNNTTMNALCVDGHVENRAAGTFMVLDLCINAPG